jgi:hypothetical protein
MPAPARSMRRRFVKLVRDRLQSREQNDHLITHALPDGHEHDRRHRQQRMPQEIRSGFHAPNEIAWRN